MDSVNVTLLPRRSVAAGDPLALAPAECARRADLSVLLVAMPFVSSHRPSIQLGLLVELARSHGFTAETLHANLDLAAAVGVRTYEGLCNVRLRAVGDWLYSVAAFGDDAPDPAGEFVERYGEEFEQFLGPEELRRVRDEVIPQHVDSVADEIARHEWDVVGFTSTFQQTVASFALARALRDRGHRARMLFGGANFEGEMGREYVRTVDVIDHAVSGEGDVAFPQYLIAVSEGRDPTTVAGVLGRDGDGKVVGIESEPFDRLDELPVPDYGEYFERAARLDIVPASGRRSIYLPFESSRGCWWGAKRHCTFCGLNGTTMSYRAKSPERVLAEIAELSRRYRSFHLEAVDNILEPSYLEEVFPALERLGVDYQMFFEVKSKLSRAQLAGLARAGVRRIQPGIESLSTRVLARMRKGVRSSTNVNLLRWARHCGIQVGWNVLWGFPGEEADEYREQLELFPRLVHLDPPGGGGRIWLERFSPLFTDEALGDYAWRRPEESTSLIYPARIDRERSAYFFEYEFSDGRHDDEYQPLLDQIHRWIEAQGAAEPPTLTIWNGVGHVQVEDRRDPDRPETHTWDEPLANVYRAAMNEPVTAARVAALLGGGFAEAEVRTALEEFCDRGVMMRDGNLYLALAIPPAASALGRTA